jgi:hypothetical protein
MTLRSGPKSSDAKSFVAEITIGFVESSASVSICKIVKVFISLRSVYTCN